MGKCEVHSEVLGIVGTNVYLLTNKETSEAVIIDPADDADTIIRLCDKTGSVPVAILLTHGHFDHIFGVKALQDRFGGIPVYMHPADEVVLDYGADMAARLGLAPAATDFRRTPVRDGQVLELAGIRFEVIATPGHTPGGVCYLVREADILFCGDTLFAGSIGRTDFPYGEYDDLIRSIMERLILLDPEVRILPGHGPTSTIGQERTGNPFLEPFNEPEEEPDPDLEPVVINRG